MYPPRYTSPVPHIAFLAITPPLVMMIMLMSMLLLHGAPTSCSCNAPPPSPSPAGAAPRCPPDAEAMDLYCDVARGGRCGADEAAGLVRAPQVPSCLVFLFIERNAVCDLVLHTVAQVLRGPRQAQSLLGCAPGGGALLDVP